MPITHLGQLTSTHQLPNIINPSSYTHHPPTQHLSLQINAVISAACCGLLWVEDKEVEKT